MAKTYLESLLGSNEKICLIARKHWLNLLQHILPEIFIILLLIVIITISWTILLTYPFMPLFYLLLIFPAISLIRDVVIWYNHQYVITNLRVIQIMGVFSKNVIDSSLEKVNDVKMEQSFWGRLLNYGDIEILTASEIGVNRFSRIGNPILFKTTMLNAKELQENHSTFQSPTSPTSLSEIIKQLDELRRKNILTEEEFSKKKAELLSKL